MGCHSGRDALMCGGRDAVRVAWVLAVDRLVQTGLPAGRNSPASDQIVIQDELQVGGGARLQACLASIAPVLLDLIRQSMRVHHEATRDPLNLADP
jgi:hypothetical protein